MKRIILVAMVCWWAAAPARAESVKKTALSAVAVNDVVKLDAATGKVAPTTAATDEVFGVATSGGAADAEVLVAVTGEAVCKCDAGVAIGEFVGPGAAAGTTDAGSATRDPDVFGVAVTAPAAGACKVKLEIGGPQEGAPLSTPPPAADAVLPMDAEAGGAPTLHVGARAVAPTASGNGWFHVYRFDGGARDAGTEDASPAPGTALPAGITGAGTALVSDGAAAATSKITVAHSYTTSVPHTGNMLVVSAHNASNAGAGVDSLFVAFNLAALQGLLVEMTDTVFIRHIVSDGGNRILNDFTPGGRDDTDHWAVSVWGQTDEKLFVDGVERVTQAKTRAGTLTFSGVTSTILFGSAGTANNWQGAARYLAAFGTPAGAGAIPYDFATDYLPGLAPADRELLGSRYMPAKWGAGRLYLGGDYEDYASQYFADMRAEGTVSLWYVPVYNADTTDVTADPVLLWVPFDGTDVLQLYYDVSADQFVFSTRSGGAVIEARSAAQTFAAGDALHLAVQWSTAGIALFLNGVVEQSVAAPAEMLPTGELSAAFRVGNQGISNPANGVIDHVRLARRAWDAAEIAADFAAADAP